MNELKVDTLNDEEFELVFKKYCTMVVFHEKRKMSISAICVFLLDRKDFMGYLLEDSRCESEIDLFRRIFKIYPNVIKSKVIINHVAKHTKQRKNTTDGEGEDDL